MASFTKNRKQPVTLHTQTFFGKEYSYGWDDLNGIISLTHFMKRYEFSQEAATDLENWSKEQKGKFERAQRLYREFGIVATDTGAERPDVLVWYNSLSDAYKERNVKVIDLENIEYEERVSDDMRRRICGDYQNYLPSFGSTYNPDEENTEPSLRRGRIVIEENGCRYTSDKPDSVRSSISTNYQDQLWNDPKHKPTVAKWYKSIGGKLNVIGVKKEQFRDPIELVSEIDLNRYKY